MSHIISNVAHHLTLKMSSTRSKSLGFTLLLQRRHFLTRLRKVEECILSCLPSASSSLRSQFW